MRMGPISRVIVAGASLLSLSGCLDDYMIGPQRPVGTVVGKLMTADGKPAAGRQVQMMWATYRAQAINPIYLGTAVVKPDGAFEAPAYDEQVKVHLLLDDGDLETARRVPLTGELQVPRGGRIDVGTLTMPAGQ